MKFGEFEIDAFVEAKFALDGGSMFGIIPKTMWQKLLPVDENNLIPMVTNLFVLRAQGQNFLFDAGLGDTLSDREKKIYGFDGVSYINEGLAGLDLTPEDINYVLLTHLHTDHMAGAVKRVDGEYQPRFPNARHVVSKQEWEDGMNPNERTRAVYIPERLEVLAKARLVDVVTLDSELFPGIKLVHTGGHTPGHYGIEMESGGQKVFYYADLFCSSAHMTVPFVPATDLNPTETMEVKRRVLPVILEQGVVMAFDHDIYTPLARIRKDGKKLVTEPIQTGLPEFQKQ